MATIKAPPRPLIAGATLLVLVGVGVVLWLGSLERPATFTVLARMVDEQHEWFQERLAERLLQLDPPLRLDLARYESLEELRRRLVEAQHGGVKIDLVKVEIEMLAPLRKFMSPLPEIGSPDRNATAGRISFITPSLEIGRLAGDTDIQQFYVPRKLETNLMFYRKQKVELAVKNWKELESEINKRFKNGLPDSYQLEDDPNLWNWYDLAVASYFWWATEGPKMAHRGKRYPGTMTEIANKIFQAGGDPDVLTLQGDETEWGSPNGWLSAYDALQWEAFFRENDLYVRAMWDERWDGTDLWKAIRDDRVYLCFLHQLDFNRLLEEGEGAILRKEQRDDIGVALLPAGASLQLSEEGLPVRRGRSASQVSGWWWGIPKEANKARSLDVIREILRDDFHAEEVADFGFLPVTKRVRRLRDDEVEREGGIGSQIWLKSWTQLDFAVQKRTWFRHDARWTPIQSCWLDAWDQVMKIEPNPEGVRPGHKSHDPIWCALSRLCRRLARIRGMDPESCFACTRPSLSAARAR